jgi:hypothetical protein
MSRVELIFFVSLKVELVYSVYPYLTVLQKAGLYNYSRKL